MCAASLYQSLDPHCTRLGATREDAAMALKDRAQQPPTRNHGLPCSVGNLLSELPTDEAQALETMLSSAAWSATDIFEALKAEGYEVGRQTIGRHRAKACRCSRASPRCNS